MLRRRILFDHTSLVYRGYTFVILTVKIFPLPGDWQTHNQKNHLNHKHTARENTPRKRSAPTSGSDHGARTPSDASARSESDASSSSSADAPQRRMKRLHRASQTHRAAAWTLQSESDASSSSAYALQREQLTEPTKSITVAVGSEPDERDFSSRSKFFAYMALYRAKISQVRLH